MASPGCRLPSADSRFAAGSDLRRVLILRLRLCLRRRQLGEESLEKRLESDDDEEGKSEDNE